MKRWRYANIDNDGSESFHRGLEDYCQAGWEPFAVTPGNREVRADYGGWTRYDRIHLRKELDA